MKQEHKSLEHFEFEARALETLWGAQLEGGAGLWHCHPSARLWDDFSPDVAAAGRTTFPIGFPNRVGTFTRHPNA